MIVLWSLRPRVRFRSVWTGLNLKSEIVFLPFFKPCETFTPIKYHLQLQKRHHCRLRICQHGRLIPFSPYFIKKIQNRYGLKQDLVNSAIDNIVKIVINIIENDRNLARFAEIMHWNVICSCEWHMTNQPGGLFVTNLIITECLIPGVGSPAVRRFKFTESLRKVLY